MGFLAEAQHLGSLETFDPGAFVPDEQWSAAVCDFVLALAVASNDLHDVFMAEFLLAEMEEAIKDRKNIKYMALAGGSATALRRYKIGVIHELLQLVKSNEKVVTSAAFQKIYRQLKRGSKESWDRIHGAARCKPQSGTLGKALLLCRNKVGFHYDASQIGKGYMARFLQDPSKGAPVLSRGNSMRSRRFYFADAAVEQYMTSLSEAREIENMVLGRDRLIEDINRALFDIVALFINARGFGFKEYRHQQN